ncbi:MULTISPECIES: stage II sporulation protein M [Anaerosinus]|uniref:Stage II sporulation protein M n=2 Tax=Selenobaculum gibii TaxID=3054208 RepID=A0A9Y2AH89_9FIRM|nr:stage II sporulation protein M [Selenobaculum gbiensis]WIW69658.1 stage II sporulation protein M [Selenobaculum gbiensis]
MYNKFRYVFLEHLKKNIAKYFFSILVLLVGIVIGAMAMKFLPELQRNELAGYLNLYLSSLSDTSKINDSMILGDVIIKNTKTILAIWILGFTIIGLPFVLGIVCLKGIVIGFTVGFLVNEYIYKGIFLALAVVLPHNLLSIPMILIMSIAAINFSLNLIKRRQYKKDNLAYSSILYSIICFILCIGIILSSLLEVYVSPVFMRWIVNLF